MTPEMREAARDLALCLENDSTFYVEYTQNALKWGGQDRRDAICDHAKSHGMRILNATAREQIRRYLDAKWGLPGPGENSLHHHPTIDLFDDGRVTANDVKKPEPQPPEEQTMNAKAIEITTKTYVNGQDIADMSDAQIYELLASEEMKIKELEKIENKPKRLRAEIERRSEGILALVKYLDEKQD